MCIYEAEETHQNPTHHDIQCKLVASSRSEQDKESAFPLLLLGTGGSGQDREAKMEKLPGGKGRGKEGSLPTEDMSEIILETGSSELQNIGSTHQITVPDSFSHHLSFVRFVLLPAWHHPTS